MTIFHDCAPRYAAQGFLIFPLSPCSKIPLPGSSGLKDATCDPDKLAAWAKAYPSANIGLCTGEASGVCVIDIDPKNGGFDTAHKLYRDGKIFPRSAVVQTRSEGLHIYVRFDARLRTGSNRLGPGIDIRGEGGYVVAPPSIVEPGAYTWQEWPASGRSGIPEAPAWIFEDLDRLAPRRSDKPAASSQPVAIQPAELDAFMLRRYQRVADIAFADKLAELTAAKPGGRNDKLFRATAKLAPYVGRGFLKQADVEAAFYEACKTNGLVATNGERDVRRTIAAGLSFAGHDLPALANRELARPVQYGGL